MSAIEKLKQERDEARSIVRDIHWMAVRYADNRKSYAVGMCNDALRKAYVSGWLTYSTEGNIDPQYARDGMFDKEWVSALNNATARAEAAESALAATQEEIVRRVDEEDKAAREMQKVIQALRDRATAAEAEIVRLRAVLAPFACFADVWDSSYPTPDGNDRVIKEIAGPIGEVATLRLGHFRAASRSLSLEGGGS